MSLHPSNPPGLPPDPLSGMTTQMTLPIGILAPGFRVFHRYELRREVGRGGMGVVWAAWDIDLELEVALKFLPEAVASDPEALRDLKRETRCCLGLQHEHIVRVHDFVQAPSLAAIAMELVPGPSLAQCKVRAPGGCLGTEELAPLVAQLGAALDYAHTRARVVHRDLKPANLLVDRTGTLKVTDFGIARSLSETRTRLSSGGTVWTSGTLLYMSPQQLAGKPPTAADDIYALGATLYELLAGKPPFYRGDVVMQIAQAVPASLAVQRAEAGAEGPPIPPAWEEVILACLAKDPEQRPASAGAVVARLGLTGGGGRVEAARVVRGGAMGGDGSLRRRATVIAGAGHAAVGAAKQRWTRRPRLALAAGLVAGVAAVAVALALAGRGRVGEHRAESTIPPGSESAAAPSPTAATEEESVLASRKSGGANHAGAGAGVVEASDTLLLTLDPVDVAARLWLGALADVPIVDGRVELSGLPPGEQELIVQAPGFQTYTARVMLPTQRPVAVKLTPVRGALVVTGRPGSAVTAVDARGREVRLGEIPASGQLLSGDALLIGTYAIRLAHRDCAPVERAGVELAPGRVAQLALTQRALSAELRVFTTPEGAQVLVAGRPAGLTPATLRDLPSEEALSVEVRLAGYRTLAQEVTLRPRETRNLALGTLAAEAGALELRGLPAGLDPASLVVEVDGRRATLADGRPGVDHVEVGERTLAVAHPDYEPWIGLATFRDGVTTTVEAALRPKPGRATLVSAPAGARLTLSPPTATSDRGGGSATDLVSPTTLSLPPGDYRVRYELAGHTAVTRPLRVVANQPVELATTLERAPGPQLGQRWENSLGMRFVSVPGLGVLFGVWETRVQDYERFAAATGEAWTMPDFAQGPLHPAVRVSWAQARAFCAWLTEQERRAGQLGPRQSYRLPTDWEWSAAAGLEETRADPGRPWRRDAAGIERGEFPWGRAWPPPRSAGNYADESMRRERAADASVVPGYNDGYAATSPVGAFTPNRFGLHDLGGNVWEWCEDFYDEAVGTHVLRGASFAQSGYEQLLLSHRGYPGGAFGDGIGFRVVVDVGETEMRLR